MLSREMQTTTTSSFLLLVAFLLLVVRPGAPSSFLLLYSSNALVTGSDALTTKEHRSSPSLSTNLEHLEPKRSTLPIASPEVTDRGFIDSQNGDRGTCDAGTLDKTSRE